MLILDANQVQYCQVSANVAGQEVLPGLTYGDNIFVKVKAYSPDELEVAIKECREKYLDNEDQQIPTLIIKGEKEISLWRQDNQYTPIDSSQPTAKLKEKENKVKNKVAVNQANNISNIDLDQLVSQLRSKEGLSIKARRYKLKLYQRCFAGNEAVDWLTHNLKISRASAVIIGQKLMEQKIIHHVLDEHPFKDEPLFYRFYEDEGKSIWTDKVI